MEHLASALNLLAQEDSSILVQLKSAIEFLKQEMQRDDFYKDGNNVLRYFEELISNMV